MLMITVMQIPEKEKNRKILKAVRVSTELLWLLTCVEDLMLILWLGVIPAVQAQTFDKL